MKLLGNGENAVRQPSSRAKMKMPASVATTSGDTGRDLGAFPLCHMKHLQTLTNRYFASRKPRLNAESTVVLPTVGRS